MPVVTDYTALISGANWSGIELSGRPVIVTYSFPTAAPAYDSTNPDIAGAVGTFQAFDAGQQTMARAALAEWSAASGLIFLEVAPGQGDLAFQRLNFTGTMFQGVGGIGYYPFGGWDTFSYPYFTTSLDVSGDVFMNTQFGPTIDYGTLLHEVGHAIGLKHPTEVFGDHDEVLASDDPNLTIMAQSGVGTGHITQLDKDAAAFLYGAAGTGGVYTGNAAGSNGLVTWSYNAAMARVTQTGGTGDDAIRGTSVKDYIYGGNGGDRLFGLAGDDLLYGGAGDDFLFGGQGSNRLYGGADDDSYFIASATDRVYENANDGYDMVYASVTHKLAANVESLQLFGSGLTGIGNDENNSMFGDGFAGTTLLGRGGDDYIVGGDVGDKLFGDAGIDTMFGQGGDDYLAGGDDNDNLYGGLGLDRLYGQGGTDVLAGEDGDDRLDGGDGDDFLYGGADNDTLYSSLGADAFDGGDEIDTVTYYSVAGAQVFLDGSGTNAGAAAGDSFYFIENVIGSLTGADRLVGDGQNNKLYGHGGHDILEGKAGVDNLYGGAGDDRLDGGLGMDMLVGNAGVDTFVFNIAPAAAGGSDRISDFVHGVDKIEIDASAFGGGLVGGGPVQLVANATPSAAGFVNGVFLYDTDNGNLTFDVNGQAAGGATLFARLSGAPTLTAGDFVIVA